MLHAKTLCQVAEGFFIVCIAVEYVLCYDQRRASVQERKWLNGEVYPEEKDEQEGAEENGWGTPQHVGILTNHQEDRQQEKLQPQKDRPDQI